MKENIYRKLLEVVRCPSIKIVFLLLSLGFFFVFLVKVTKTKLNRCRMNAAETGDLLWKRQFFRPCAHSASSAINTRSKPGTHYTDSCDVAIWQESIAKCTDSFCPGKVTSDFKDFLSCT